MGSRTMARCALAPLLVLVLCAAVAPAFTVEAVQAFQPVDEYLLKQMWYARPSSDGPGLELRAMVVTALGSLGRKIAEDDPAFPFFARWEQLFWAHHELMGTRSGVDEKDPAYIDAFREAEKTIFSQLPPNPDERQGHMVTYAVLLERGILRRIVEQAGPLPADAIVPTEIAPADRGDVWGVAGQSFVVGGTFAVDPQVRDSALAFHCCDGRIVISSLGALTKPYLEAHGELLKDPAYARLFRTTTEKFAQQAESIPRPLDAEGVGRCRAITKDYRAALEASGILDRIEGRAQAEKMQAQGHEDPLDGK